MMNTRDILRKWRSAADLGDGCGVEEKAGRHEKALALLNQGYFYMW